MNGKRYAREVFESIQPNLTSYEKLFRDERFGKAARKIFEVEKVQVDLEKLELEKPDTPRFNPKIDYFNLPK
jgi:hypothetical protein